MHFPNITLAGLIALSSLSLSVSAFAGAASSHERADLSSSGGTPELASRNDLHVVEKRAGIPYFHFVKREPAKGSSRGQNQRNRNSKATTKRGGTGAPKTTTKAAAPARTTTRAQTTSKAIKTTKTRSGTRAQTTSKARTTTKTRSGTRTQTTSTTRTRTTSSSTSASSTATARPVLARDYSHQLPKVKTCPINKPCNYMQIADPENPGKCITCEAGTEPDILQMECVAQSPCAAGEMRTANDECQKCPTGTQPNYDGTLCVKYATGKKRA